MKEFDIDGVITTPGEMGQDELMDKFIKFLESINCTFGGKIEEVTKDTLKE